MSIFLLILGLVMFVLLVVVHELGHFIIARWGGVDVEEFGIGFPPRAWSKKLKSGLLLTINWLPLGGFVRLKGEHDSDTEKGSFGAASLGTKTKIMLAGVAMNLIAAFVLLTILAWAGMPKLVDNQYSVKRDIKTIKNQVLIAYIEPGSPAEKAGLLVRDQLLSIGPVADYAQNITAQEQLSIFTKQFAGQKVTITISRGGAQQARMVALLSNQEVQSSLKTNNHKGYLGVSPTEYTLTRSTWSAPIVAGGLIGQFTSLTLQGLGKALGALFTGNGGEASAQVAGPVGIFKILKSGSLLGYQFVLMIVAIISLTLAIMNVLPIPALDGGRLFVTYLFRFVRRPLGQRAEDLIHGTGFVLLMALFVLITIIDVRR